MRGDRERLEDILEAIQRIEARIRGGRAEFDNDETLQVWVVYHLQVIGEAARSLE